MKQPKKTLICIYISLLFFFLTSIAYGLSNDKPVAVMVYKDALLVVSSSFFNDPLSSHAVSFYQYDILGNNLSKNYYVGANGTCFDFGLADWDSINDGRSFFLMGEFDPSIKAWWNRIIMLENGENITEIYRHKTPETIFSLIADEQYEIIIFSAIESGGGNTIYQTRMNFGGEILSKDDILTRQGFLFWSEAEKIADYLYTVIYMDQAVLIIKTNIYGTVEKHYDFHVSSYYDHINILNGKVIKDYNDGILFNYSIDEYDDMSDDKKKGDIPDESMTSDVLCYIEQNGNIRWEKKITYGKKDKNRIIHDVVIDEGGNIIITGSKDGKYLYRSFSSAGVEICRADAEEGKRGYQLQETGDHMLVAETIDDKFCFELYGGDCTIVALKCYNDNIKPIKMNLDQDDGIIILGYINEGATNSSSDVKLIRYNSNLNKLWDNIIRGEDMEIQCRETPQNDDNTVEPDNYGNNEDDSGGGCGC